MSDKNDEEQLSDLLQPMLDELYALNECQVFFTHNAQESNDWNSIFGEVAQSKGLRPVYWAGAGLTVRQSTLNHEITVDCYNSSTVVIYLGTPKPGSDVEDLWVLANVCDLMSIGRHLLIYASSSYPLEVLAGYGYTGDARRIDDGESFRSALQEDLPDA